jgi:amino-acid N-acetyltransferase
MGESTIALRRVDDDAIRYVEDLLSANDLPAADVRAKPDCFYVGYDGDAPVCAGGVERYGADGLLRSVVVEQSARGRGIGTALCDELEARAAADGVETLYLLTTTATDFFAGRGYVEVAREDAPPAIRGTTEFAELCPDTATCMRRAL